MLFSPRQNKLLTKLDTTEINIYVLYQKLDNLNYNKDFRK